MLQTVTDTVAYSVKARVTVVARLLAEEGAMEVAMLLVRVLVAEHVPEAQIVYIKDDVS